MTNKNPWVETGDICPACDFVGHHLVVDETVFCGRCQVKIPDAEIPDPQLDYEP